MPGLLGSPTLTKMTVDAIGRLWRRLKKSKKQASEQGPEQDLEQDLHAFYSDSSESTEYLESYPGPLACFESVQGWVNGTSDTSSFDGQANLFCGVSVRGNLADPAEAVEPILPIKPIKPAKRGIKDVLKNVKAVFKQPKTSG